MLPRAYVLPAGILLVLGGALACFAGYRLFRLVLGIYGFILGAMLASSMMGVSNTIGMVLAAILGGLIGSAILVFAYFVGIALVGSGLGVLLAHLMWSQFRTVDPPAVAIVVASIVGAVGAMLLQRYFVIVATAFGGAWTVIVGAFTVARGRGALGGRLTADPWVFYPLSPASGDLWVLVAWVSLGVIGTIVQLALARRRR
jgi:hypothetical protein